MTTISDDSEWSWFCLRSQPKREHIAAAHVRMLEGVEVYCPRLRLERMTRRGRVWFIEALFPGYLFARFELNKHQKLVTYAQGVTGIVKFGLEPTAIPEKAINELRSHLSDGENIIQPGELNSGDRVIVTGGIFRGLETLVTRIVPGTERVRILLEFLGDCREVEILRSDLLHKEQHIMAA